ncbi:MAG: hypothetical protein A2491_19925 [Bacteroidetes bacterium RIFOXYC12_FULL_35_7]|nr:MAG: hypothetical protein A2491_19925 [Bacteroidetes bacterium RIFOXYC12_FULL_35_7]
MKTHIFLFVSLSFFLFFSCNNKEKSVVKSCSAFDLRGFLPISNQDLFKADSGKTIQLDYKDAYLQGFRIPSFFQTKEGKFTFHFQIRNTSGVKQSFHYKIYYQNESYKFPETDPLSEENFYGSWEASGNTFAETEMLEPNSNFHDVSGSFCIQGNPRDEKQFFHEDRNERWKRNPRTGNYSFLLVVTTKSTLEDIPECIRDVRKKRGGNYVNPYLYFLFDDGARLANTVVWKSDEMLNVVAKPDLGSGIYINPYFLKSDYSKEFYSNACGEDEHLLKQAAFEQFIHYVDSSTRFFNVPVIEDVINGKFSKMDYNWNNAFYKKEELIGVIPATSDRPCETVISDQENKKIIIHNPKSEFGKWQKQNVGVISRHGFSFGKYTVKAKLTELLNKNNVWCGITNAIWLIAQGSADGGLWNMRRNCNREGYMATYWGGYEDKRIPYTNYSEIDFEILKTVPYCPSYQYPPMYQLPGDDASSIASWNIPQPDETLPYDDKIAVACTNWDMACPEPKNYGWGCNDIVYKNQIFSMHRWEKKYRAVTEKSMENDDELFGRDYYYFQIEWKPDEIIWRIGPEKNKLRVAGYMNSTVTSIPNNQMLLIISQEYHNTKWWPGSPYQQDNIPFLKSDLKGEIFEITIE